MRTSTQHTENFDGSGSARPRRLTIAALSLGAALALSACGGGQQAAEPTTGASEQPGEQATTAASTASAAALGTAALADTEGASVGEVTISEADGGLQIEAQVENMEPGFYGFHVHQVGACEPDSAAPDDPSETGAFLSAGSHIPGADGTQHPGHAGDLPTLLVNEDGAGSMTVVTDRLDEALLTDDDGSAIMVHSLPDNFANIPERYAPAGPDEATVSTGDAGDRLACGVVEGS